MSLSPHVLFLGLKCTRSRGTQICLASWCSLPRTDTSELELRQSALLADPAYALLHKPPQRFFGDVPGGRRVEVGKLEVELGERVRAQRDRRNKGLKADECVLHRLLRLRGGQRSAPL